MNILQTVKDKANIVFSKIRKLRGFRLLDLYLTLAYSQGQLGSENDVLSNILAFLFLSYVGDIEFSSLHICVCMFAVRSILSDVQTRVSGLSSQQPMTAGGSDTALHITEVKKHIGNIQADMRILLGKQPVSILHRVLCFVY